MDFSIAICTYNNARLLRWTLEGLTRVQVPSGLVWELLVVDNNSTDDTRRASEEFADRLPLRYVFEPTQGLSHARRRALRETTAPCLAFIDDDCLLAPDWLREAVRFCQDHPRAGAVGGRVRLLWEAPPTPLARYCELNLAGQDRGDEPLQLPPEGFTYLVGAGLIVRRSVVTACGWDRDGYLTDRRGKELSSGGDSEMVLRIRNAGWELWYSPTLELQHWIPRQRMAATYLCRLTRGMGQSQVYLDLLGRRETLGFADRARVVWRSLVELCHQGWIAFREFRWNGRLGGSRRIDLYRSFGYLEGAWRLLWHGYRL